MQSQSALRVGEHPAPFRNSTETAKGLAVILAMVVRLLLRRNIGFALLKKTYLAGLVVFFIGANWLGNLHFSLLSLFGGGVRSEGDGSLRLYALFVLIPLWGWQYYLRLREEKQGQEPHNFWPGDSWFSFLPLPQQYIHTGVDTLVALIAGALLRYRLNCPLLGLWMMFSAVAFFIVERTVYRQAIEQRRTKRDLMKEAAWDAETMEEPRPAASSARATDGLATGSDDELEAQIERRRRVMENAASEGGMLQ
jgi:hypothetical protein